jgi:TRAP-type C4-dicarboxylate transport system permease small subunit
MTVASSASSPPGRRGRFTEGFGQATVGLFGIVMVTFAIIVTIETIGRKFFNISFQGVDELGGYVLAVTSSLAFSLALIDRAHIRIDLFHRLLPRPIQRMLDLSSTTLMTLFALLLAYAGWQTVQETVEFGSTAPTPWATPLIWPQSLWFAALAVFALFALAATARAFRLAAAGRWRELDRAYGPKGTEEEICEELADLQRR